jgi:hypothetical protein
MKFRSHSRVPDLTTGDTLAQFTEHSHLSQGEDEEEDSTLIKTVGWISAGLGAVAIGLFVGRELRQRYKFNHRTPYDAYAHAGDEQDVDFGLGI